MKRIYTHKIKYHLVNIKNNKEIYKIYNLDDEKYMYRPYNKMNATLALR